MKDELAPLVRTMAVEALEFLGLTLDPDRNGQGDGEGLISTADSTVEIWVIQTNEEWIIARDAYRLASVSEPQ